MKIALLGPFSSFPDTYSLAHVFVDQAVAITRHWPEAELSLWCCKGASLNNSPLLDRLKRHNIKILDDIVPGRYVPDQPDYAQWGDYCSQIKDLYRKDSPDVVIAHDLLFQSHYIDYACAIHDLANEGVFDKSLWLHYFHSFVSEVIPKETINTWARLRIPDGHFVVYPNKIDADKIAQTYKVHPKRVLSCPNVHDASRLWGTSDEAQRIVEMQSLDSCEVVQIFPVCSTRLMDKGLNHVVRLFGELSLKTKCCLVVANSNAKGEEAQRNINAIKDLATRSGGDPDIGKWLRFTSDLPEYADAGVPSNVVQDLFRYSSFFFIPSAGEACSLAYAEAAMAGCLCLINSNVGGLVEYAPASCPRFEFDAAGKKVAYTNPSLGLSGDAAYFYAIKEQAEQVLAAHRSNPVLAAKRKALRLFSPAAFAEEIRDIISIAISRKETYGSRGYLGLPGESNAA